MMLSPRQIHLDFHTSEHIPAIGAAFDPAVFAQTAKDAAISSMTVFARCHHGWLYYDSEKFPEMIHPNLERKNLMTEQVDALHAVGIRAPIYVTVQWDHWLARTRPEWLIRKPGGAHEGGAFSEPGFYQSLCVNTGYYQYLKEITIELCELLGDKLDGLFYDIVGYRSCWCAACRAEMKRLGIDTTDTDAVHNFSIKVIDRFKANLSDVVRSYKPDASIFYNAGHVGPEHRPSAPSYSHFELESLPSGSWGYLHFPASARYARTLDKACMGMTGKFHTEWGDFHSLKNLAALEFECFRMLSYGFACSVGDQLEPYGVLNSATYKLIGTVFSQMQAREAWALDSAPVIEAAVVTPAKGSAGETLIPDSIMGATQMLEELSIQFDIIDLLADLSAYPLLLLPDDLVVDTAYQQKLNAYTAQGGRILAFGKGGLSSDGKYPDCFGTAYLGETEKHPDFIQTGSSLTAGLTDGEYVIYQRGETINPTAATPIMHACAPYFNREGDRFCSHRYTPSAKGEPYPVGVKNGNVILLSHPVLSQYRENAPLWCKQIVSNAIDQLLPQRLLRHNGPSILTSSILHQPQHRRFCVHLLSYVPVRKSATIDIIEERTVLRDIEVTLHLPSTVQSARLVPENLELSIQDHKLVIPKIDGYAILELKY